MTQFRKLAGAAAPEPSDLAPDLSLKLEYVSVDALIGYAGNARTHSAKQIHQIAASMRQFGFVSPVLLGDDNTIIAGHGRVAAAKLIGTQMVPTVRLSHLSPAERKAYAIADNRLAELSGWDDELLAIELKSLADLDLDFDLEITGFDGAELDQILDFEAQPEPDADDAIPELQAEAVTRLGDTWVLGPHRLHCGDARSSSSYEPLMAGEVARMCFTDPPYNVAIDGHVGGLGKVHHQPFVMASGEMTSPQFTDFLGDAAAAAAAVSCDGAIHYVCMDWRHLPELLAAGAKAYAEMKNLIVWAKPNAGMGAFYRSQHELIAVYKVGTAPHINTFGLGDKGRYRTNVWTYPGINSFGKGRDEALSWHPTVKPVAMVADAIKDVSHRGDIVLDPFGGSGTTLIAAEKTGRLARLLELDPRYCDLICRRWAARSGAAAILERTGQTFDQVAAETLEASGE